MKTALVTGGSRGIGEAIVRRLHQDGWRVALSYHSSPAQARKVTEETSAIAIKADLRNEDEIRSLFDSAFSCLGHLDALVLNAGISYSGLLSDMSASDWDNMLSTNLRGAFLCAREVIPHMVGRKEGSLLFVSSVWGLYGASYEAAYSASKAGIIGLSGSLAQELGPSGIRVNCLAPGVIDTGMLDRFTQDEKNNLIKRTPLSRLGRPQDVADAALFLLSDKASFITGQVLGVDGGFR